jgi:hypothetical protein
MKSPCRAINFKLAFNYCVAFDAAAKIDSGRVIIARGKADRKWLLRL